MSDFIRLTEISGKANRSKCDVISKKNPVS